MDRGTGYAMRGGRAARRAPWLLPTLLASSCPAPDPVVRTARLVVQTVPSCPPPERTSALVVTALVDAPASDRLVDRVRPSDGPRLLESLPPGTEELLFESEDGGSVGRQRVPLEGERHALLLPIGRLCPLGDPLAVALPGSVAAPLPDGRVLLAGGRHGADGTRNTLVLRAADDVGDAVASGLVLPRSDATATAVGSRVLVAGGAAGATGPAHDTFELLDETGANVDGRLRPMCAGSGCEGRRREHGAAALPDGRVLLVGGVVRDDAPPLSTAVIVDPVDGDVEMAGALPAARRAPLVVTLVDGLVLVIGGYGAGGGYTNDVYAYDPATRSFVRPVAVPGGGPVLVHPTTGAAAAVALPGARAAFVGGRLDEGASRTVTLLERVPSTAGVALRTVRLERALPVGLYRVVAAALPDGRLFVTGLDTTGAQRAFVLDLESLEADAVEPWSGTRHAVVRTDGAFALLGDVGAALLRLERSAPLMQPPATIVAAEPGALVRGAPGDWRAEGSRLRAARDEVRLDVPALRFGRFRIRLEAGGTWQLLLVNDGTPAAEVTIRDERAGPTPCEVDRAPGALVTVERRGDTITLESGRGRRDCSLRGAIGARVGIGLRALSAGSWVGRIQLERLP
ncbi:MAG: hypothetical protein NZ898_05220 [Myxococcota bacterium]|nr:hypothetical protein [Myxococcota bacterium]